jgi:outer membrane receptor protein involved in Fe transport
MKIMKVTILLASFLLFLFVSNAMAQNAGKIGGSILSKAEKAAEGATIALLRSKDSATVKFTAANKEGVFHFENVADGKYLVSVTAVGHQKAFSNIAEINPRQQIVQLPAISLMPVSKNLVGVTVTASRPLIEQRIDRTIVNVDASITNIGTSALEVLEKSPGITVDRDGNISLKGKEGVLVMIDDRPTQLGGADLANLLRNMTSALLDQIEIMTNPPARYDAAGNAGIINIKTKKTSTAGYNGSATVGYTQGRYPKTNEGFNFNYREGKVNLFTNLSHNYRKNFGGLTIQRNIRNNNTSELENYFDQQGERIGEGNAYNAKAGLDYFVTKKTTVGIVLNGSSSPSSSQNQNITGISNISKNLESVTKATVDNTSDWKSFSSNLNFRTLLNSKGRELTSDIDFITYGSTNRQFMVNSYFNATGNAFRKADTLQGYLPQNINVYSGRVDYLHPLKKNSKIEAGIKSSMVKTDNNAAYDSIQNGRIVHDFNRSNHFVYEENINAAYVNLSTSLSKKISVQAGLRLENTNAKGVQLTTGDEFVRNYTQLFPTVYFQYKWNEKNNFGANFGRRIRRPNYESLNPFIRFIDRYTYSQGNPNLKPQFSNNIELSHTYANFLTTTLNYTATNDIIQQVIEQKGQEAYATQANIASLKQFGIAISANKAITKWWTNSLNVNIFNNSYKGIVNNTFISLTTTSFIVTGTQQFKLSQTLTAELSGRYRNGWLEGVMRAKPVGFIGAGLSKQVMKNKGTLRLTARDIFHTQKFRGVGKYGNVDFNFQEVNDTQVVAIGFTYRFSKGKKIAPTKRTAGSANEEQERIEN